MTEPSKVLHVRNVGQEITENDLLQLVQPFGVVGKLVMLRAKNQALIQMQDVASAVNVVQYYTNLQPSVRGRNVYIQFSSHQELTTVDQNSQGRNQEVGTGLSMEKARSWYVESKTFEMLIKGGNSGLRIVEKGKRKQGSIFLQRDEIAWLVGAVEGVLDADTLEVFWDPTSAGYPRVLVQRRSNRHGNYIFIEEFERSNRRGSILIPEGRYGQGWIRLVAELRSVRSNLWKDRVFRVNKTTLVDPARSFAEVVGRPKSTLDFCLQLISSCKREASKSAASAFLLAFSSSESLWTSSNLSNITSSSSHALIRAPTFPNSSLFHFLISPLRALNFLANIKLGEPTKEKEDHQTLTLSTKPSTLSHIFSNLNGLFPFCKHPLIKIMGAWSEQTRRSFFCINPG
jgi:hypothetical protein